MNVANGIRNIGLQTGSNKAWYDPFHVRPVWPTHRSSKWDTVHGKDGSPGSDGDLGRWKSRWGSRPLDGGSWDPRSGRRIRRRSFGSWSLSTNAVRLVHELLPTVHAKPVREIKVREVGFWRKLNLSDTTVLGRSISREDESLFAFPREWILSMRIMHGPEVCQSELPQFSCRRRFAQFTIRICHRLR